MALLLDPDQVEGGEALADLRRFGFRMPEAFSTAGGNPAAAQRLAMSVRDKQIDEAIV